MDFADPSGNLAQFGLTEGQFVADFGAGSGHYSFAAARAVGSTGRVYAVEVQKDLLDRLKKQAREEGLGNIEIVWGDIERLGGVKIRDHLVDAVILSNVLFQIGDKQGLVQEVSRVLKPKGRVLIIDWSDSFNNMGPSEDSIFKAPDARLLFEGNGYVFEQNIEVGAHHYGFSVGKKG